MNPRELNTPAIKYLAPNNLYEQINTFTAGMAVTKGGFELLVDKCTFADMEWNHMDQQHRPAIHHTYEKGIRIALGEKFAVSLTQWKKWPLFITVTDVYVAKGLFYQSMTIAGIIFLHSVISMEQVSDRINMKNDWFIASHKLFKFLHKWLDKKLYKLNARLQTEDAQIRHGRYVVRQQGYSFRNEPADYYNSNSLALNTIYPELGEQAFVVLDGIGAEPILKTVGNLAFIIKKAETDAYFIWPAVCPHEGGPLAKGTFCEAQITCPWHHLRFTAVQLSKESHNAARYGFEYTLGDNKIYIKQTEL